jgi:adenylate cyclase
MSEDTANELGGQKARVTTLFCDIRGSSQLAERLSPQEMVELLNAHFTAMTEIIFNWRGTLDKYIGDEIMAVFGAPISTGDDAYAAVCAALDLQRVNQELNVDRRRDGQPEIQVGIGIDTGEVVAGYIGSPMRMDYTVVGDRVNTAKRFCDMAAAGKVVVGQETWEEIEDRVAGVPIGNVRLKGKEQAVLAHEIVSLK